MYILFPSQEGTIYVSAVNTYMLRLAAIHQNSPLPRACSRTEKSPSLSPEQVSRGHSCLVCVHWQTVGLSLRSSKLHSLDLPLFFDAVQVALTVITIMLMRQEVIPVQASWSYLQRVFCCYDDFWQ